MSAMQAISKAANSAGQKAPVTANKSLTTTQDFHTSLGDSIRQRVARDQAAMDSFNYKYDKGQRVFTEDSAQKNWPPMTVLSRALEGNRMMRENPDDILSKKIIDELTGKPKRTPPEPGYRVRLEHSPDNWSEFLIPESAIKGAVSEAKGGAIRMQVGGLSKLAKVFKAPQAEAMRLAQQRAALSPAKGGLGLPADNTPAQRAKAMGFDTDVYHGSRQDFNKFKGDQPVFAAENPDVASKYGNAIYPLKLRGESLEISDLGKDGTSGWFANNLAKELKIPKKELEDLKMPRGEFKDSFMDKLESLWIKKFGDTRFSDIGERAMVNKLPKHGIDRLKVNDMSDMGGTQTQHMIPAESDNIRSRFAAFDPFRKDAATAAAMGVAAPDLLAEEKAKGGGVRMQVGGLGTVAKLAAAEKVAPAAKVAKGFTPKLFESTTSKMLDDILEKNPKLTPEAAFKKARDQAEAKLTWERETKPALVKQYGPLARASYEKTKVNKMQNTDEAVQKRIQKANEFLDQPTEPWTPPKPELQAFDRSSIKDAIEGFPGVEQSAFPRDIPTRASTSHVEGLYTDPVNRELIKKQINRGLPLGGETFYGSLYPIKQAVLEAGMPAEKFDKWVHSLAPASARNSIINETAVGQFLRDMNARGIPLTEENVAIEMAKYKQKFGVALPLMPVHRQGVANVLEGGQDLREMSKANIPTNYKIPTYGAQKTGDFGKSVVLDVHEAAGQTQGSRYHPYFKEQGGFGNTEYNAGEQGMMGIAEELGIPGGMAQAGRWFGGGELTGLKSPRGDALDILERQVAYTLKQQGKQPNPAMIRNEILNQIKTGEGQLLPWYKSEGIPDVRETGLQRKEGGSVEAPPFHDFDQIMNRKDGGTVNTTFEQRLKSAIDQHMAGGGEVHMVEGGSSPPKKDLPEMSPQKYLELLALQPKLGVQSEKQIKAFLEEQYRKEKEEGFADKQARTDRAFKTATPFIGAGADIGNFLANIPSYATQGLSAVGNYAMSKSPSMSKPASVLDTEGTGDRVPKYPLQSLPEVEPFYGQEAMQRDAKNAGLMGESESPVYDMAMQFLAPYGAYKAPKAIKGGLNATRSGLENTTAAVRNPFQSAMLTMEGVAPDAGQVGGDKFKELLTRRLITNEGAPVNMNIMGGRKTDKTLGQGLYENKAGVFETNPMVGVNIPRAGNLSTNKQLLADIGTAGQELGQEMVAAHKFTPLLFGNPKDATAMMVRGADGAPLNQKQIIGLAKELPDMIATHSPKAGGMFIAPYRGDALDYAKVQEAASRILGKNAQIKFGKADQDKDIMYRGDYKDMGARAPSAESIAMRDRLKKAEARIVRAPSKSPPVSPTQPPTLTSTLHSVP